MRSVINATGGQGIIAYYNESDSLSREASWFNTTTGLIHSGAFITWRVNIPGFFRLHVAYEAGSDTYTVRLWHAINPAQNNGKLGELIRGRRTCDCEHAGRNPRPGCTVAGCNQYNAHTIDLDSPAWLPAAQPQFRRRGAPARLVPLPPPPLGD